MIGGELSGILFKQILNLCLKIWKQNIYNITLIVKSSVIKSPIPAIKGCESDSQSGLVYGGVVMTIVYTNLFKISLISLDRSCEMESISFVTNTTTQLPLRII